MRFSESPVVMPPEALAQVRALLADSLVVWRVRAAIEPADRPALAVIRAEDGTMVWVEAASESEAPIRWWVRWCVAGGSSPQRSRPCTSAVGLLRTTRDALGAEGGRRLRIGAAGGGA